MFQFFKEPDKYLYQYRTAQTTIEHILRNGTLRISRYINTNDPKEAKDWQFNIGTNENRDLSSYDTEETSSEITHELKHRTNVACFCKDKSDLSGNHVEDIFKRGFCKPRMWASYAGNHTGVCLIFNKQQLENEISDQFSSGYETYRGSVEYTNRLIIEDVYKSAYTINIDYLETMGLPQYAKAHIVKHHGRLFFEKALDWRDEDEYRWVIFGSKQEDLYLEYKDSLEGIVFGADTSEQDISIVESIAEEASLKFEQLVWKNCTPWFSFRPKWAPRRYEV